MFTLLLFYLLYNNKQFYWIIVEFGEFVLVFPGSAQIVKKHYFKYYLKQQKAISYIFSLLVLKYLPQLEKLKSLSF